MKHCLSFLCLTSHDSPSFTRNVHEKEKIYQEQRYLLSSLSTCLCSTTPLTRQFPILEPDTHEERQVSLFPEKTPGAVSLCHHEAIHLLLSTLLSNHLFLIFGIKKGSESWEFCCRSALLPVTCSESNNALCMVPIEISSTLHQKTLYFLFLFCFYPFPLLWCLLLFLGHTKGTAM